MTWKSYAVVSGATVLAGWLASSPPSNAPNSGASGSTQAPPGAAPATDIEQQALRLHARLRSEGMYVEPRRDPFRFGIRQPVRGTTDKAPVSEPQTQVSDPESAAPRVSLSGIAEDHVEGRVERTAILSSPAGVLLVREGDDILGHYRVVRIESEAVELLTLTDGTTSRLTLAH